MCNYEKRLIEEIPLVISFTENYFIPACVCLSSILKHTSGNECFHVVCLSNEDLPNYIKIEMKKLSLKRLRFTFLNLSGVLSDVYIDERYTEAASYRLLLPDLLTQYDKVLYIDCDVVVRNDLAKLYREVDVSNYYLAGVFEATLDFQKEYLVQLGVQPGHYINSGFLLINLEELRKDDMVSKFLEASKVSYLQFPDQDVINVLCQNKILGLSPVYNSIRTFFLPQYKNDFLSHYSLNDWKDVQKYGTIHYTGAKPWDAYTVKFDVWWENFFELPGSIKKHSRISKKVFLLYYLYLLLAKLKLVDFITNTYRGFKRL